MQTKGMVENTWESIENALRPLVQTDDGAQEIASAFYDVAWVPLDSRFQTYTEALEAKFDGDTQAFALTWRGAGSWVAEMRGKDEYYSDWCWDAVAGQISPRVLAAMTALGLRPVT